MVVNREFSQHLERTEARANADFVDTRARLEPDSGAAWIEVGGAFAMYDGAESPLTQTFGLGIFEDIKSEYLDEIESFYREHDAPVFHEISPLTDQSHMTMLSERGYRPVELTTVMFRELGGVVAKRERNADLRTRVIEPEEVETWARTSADAWASEHEAFGEFMFKFGSISAQCEGSFPYIVELAGEPIAAAMLLIYDDVCILAGAATLPRARRLGAQTALLEDRLTKAAASGCKFAILGAAPGSQSQLNAQKNEFQIAYTRTKWMLT